MELITANCDNLLMEIRKIFREEVSRANSGVDRPFLTRKDVCEMLSVSPSTLRNWAKIGTLAPVKLAGSGRVTYRREDVEALLKKWSH